MSLSLKSSVASAPARAARVSRTSRVVCYGSAVEKAPKQIKRDETVAAGMRALALAQTAAILSQAAPAKAEDSVDSAVDAVVGVVKTTGGFLKATVDTASAAVKVLQEGYEVAAPVVKSGYEASAPFIESAVKATGEVAGPVLKAAGPALQAGLKEVGKGLESSGLNLKVVGDTAATVTKTSSEVATTATPFLKQFVTFVTTTDPVTLGEYGLGLVALYYLAPPLLGAAFGSLRGYAGEVTAAAALDVVMKQGDTVIIDIRTQKEKEAAGVPDVPGGASGRVLEVEYAATEDRKLRGQLKDPSAIEASVTALQIAALKKVNKGTKIILLDRYGGLSQTIAKELGQKGFSKVFVVAGGFDGRGGWVQSKLQIKPSATVLSSPSPFSRPATISTRRALPAPRAS